MRAEEAEARAELLESMVMEASRHTIVSRQSQHATKVPTRTTEPVIESSQAVSTHMPSAQAGSNKRLSACEGAQGLDAVPQTGRRDASTRDSPNTLAQLDDLKLSDLSAIKRDMKTA